MSMAYQERRIASVNPAREVPHNIDDAHDSHQWHVTTTFKTLMSRKLRGVTTFEVPSRRAMQASMAHKCRHPGNTVSGNDKNSTLNN